MRSITFIFLAICLGCTTPKNASVKQDKLNGTWTPVQQEIAGNPLPKAVFESQKLVISDSTYTFSAESVDKGIVKYHDDKMDIYGKEGVNAGKHFTAIYKLDSGQLTICYNLKGDSYPIAFETKTQPTLFLSIFKKEEVNR
jgi:uncharacterized protein (TIGR03067 family)